MKLKRHYILNFILSLLTLLIFCDTSNLLASSDTQIPEEILLMKKELKGKWLQYVKAVSAEPQMLDVQKYTVILELSPLTYSIKGDVIIEGQTEEETLDTVIVDMNDELIIDSLMFKGLDKDYIRENNQVLLSFSPPLQTKSSFEISISYHASIQPDQERGMIFSVHGEDNVPVISTLSEPYLAPSWWPCIDDPSDKALAELYFTCPSEINGEEMRAISNGVLESKTLNDDGSSTFHWSVKNPISTYLVCVAISNYINIDSLSDTYTSLDGSETMPLEFYCYPEHLEKAEYVFGQVKDEILLFSGLFGEYPFIDEKHAIIEIPMESSGMEHQTITCIQDEHVAEGAEVSRVTVGHEVAHQWWGDSVTMKTWDDIWLNEGFATFFQMYYREAFGEIEATIDKLQIFGTGLFGDSYQDSVYVRDVSDPFANAGAIYFKGSWVVHMLREMINDDEAFFTVLKSYYQKYAYGNATTADLKEQFKIGWGEPLDSFFDQWVYTPAWPIYNYGYTVAPKSDGKYNVDIQLFQTQDHSVIDKSGNIKRDYYIMPVDLTLGFEDGSEQTVTLLNNHRQQRFKLETDSQPVSVDFDKEMNLLRDVNQSLPLPSTNILPTAWGFAMPLGKKLPMKVILFGGGNDEDGTIKKYTWIIDNKHSIDGRFAIATLEETGKHQIFLTVEDDKGAGGSSLPVNIDAGL